MKLHEEQAQKLSDRFQKLGHSATVNFAWHDQITGLVAFAYEMGRIDGRKKELIESVEQLKLLEKMNAES